jgi:hypothetical protein
MIEHSASSTVLIGEQPLPVARYSPAQHRVEPQMILVAGPLRSGTNDDPWRMEANEAVMTEISLRLFRAGHLPVMGEWFAFPLIEHAGGGVIGDAIYSEIFHPVARRLVEKCDAVLRIGGPSEGADDMVVTAWRLGKKAYFALEDVPGVAN